MANTLSKAGITTGATVETWHVTQSIDAFTATEAYDISISGSLDVNFGLLTVADTTINMAGGFILYQDITAISIGKTTAATGNSSFSQGINSEASGDYSHAEGNATISSGTASHAEGNTTIASGTTSHAEGKNTQAIGDGSHAEGDSTIALGQNSHAGGIGTIASGSNQTVVGSYNTHGDYKSPFIVGLGSSDGNRKDVFKVTTFNSIIIPQTQSVKPAWSGSDGEIVPATVGGKYLLYMWMAGAWRSGSFV